MTNIEKRNGQEENENVSRAERVRDSAAESIGGAAGAVRKRSDSTHDYLSEKTDSVEETLKEKTGDAADAARSAIDKGREAGHKAADRLSSTSDYLQNVDIDELKANASEKFRQNPGLVLASAGIAGLIIGYLLGRKTG